MGVLEVEQKPPTTEELARSSAIAEGPRDALSVEMMLDNCTKNRMSHLKRIAIGK